MSKFSFELLPKMPNSKFSFGSSQVYLKYNPFDEDVRFKNYTVLMVAIEKRMNDVKLKNMIDSYIERGIDFESCNSKGVNVLYVGMVNENSYVIKRMLECNCDVQRVLPCGSSPLQAYADSAKKRSGGPYILKILGEKIGFLSLWKTIRRNKLLVTCFHDLYQRRHFFNVDFPRDESYNWILDGAVGGVDDHGNLIFIDRDEYTAIDEKYFTEVFQKHQRRREIAEFLTQTRMRDEQSVSTHSMIKTNDDTSEATSKSVINFLPKKYLSTLPKEFICSICLEPFNNPTTTSAGNVYCKECIESSIAKGNLRDPLTNTPITRNLCPASLVYRLMNEYEEK